MMRMGYLKFNTTDGINVTLHDMHELAVEKDEVLLVADLDNTLFKGLVALMGINIEVQEPVKKEKKDRKPTGRPVVDAKKVEMALNLYKYNLPVHDIAYHTGLSKATIYKKIKESQLKECI